jgi:hypothetical protein
MFANQDLQMVLRRQAELRREAKHDRLAAKVSRHEKTEPRTRRVLGLRVSIA